jgi:hypothetical protein
MLQTENIPCAMQDGKPKSFAGIGCTWMGFQSPLSVAYLHERSVESKEGHERSER